MKTKVDAAQIKMMAVLMGKHEAVKFAVANGWYEADAWVVVNAP